MAKHPSTVAYQVMWNRLISVVEEQAQAQQPFDPAEMNLL